jgi:tetratricopeptide (TPR) repeat protein
MNGADPLRRWKTAGLVAWAAIVLIVPLNAFLDGNGDPGVGLGDGLEATFVGRERCAPCHRAAFEAWTGSNHDDAMAEADETTVLGDFDDAVFESGGITSRFYREGDAFMVRTEGPDGEPADYRIAYTFGVEPLQQYLVPFPGGRLQCLSIAWDVERGRWFDLYPDQDIPPGDWLHWTRGGQNWNGMCAECHSTNLRKGYDPDTKSFSTTWSEIDVSCEACHGPGSRHVSWAEIQPMARPDIDDYGLVVRTGGIPAQDQVELCAPCHSRRSEIGDYDHRQTALLENLLPSVLEEGLYHADGQIQQEVYVYGSFLQSKMYRNDVRCGDCHDVHSLRLVKEGNDLCLQCHRADTYDTPDHHFHKKIHEGKPSDGALCVKCHMPEQPFMVIDYRADHSLRIPRPDLSVELGTPNACNQPGCHADKSDRWSLDYFTQWYGKSRRWHYGKAIAAGRNREPGAEEELVRLAEDRLYPPIVRATALSLLGDYPEADASRTFDLALSDEDPLLRYIAVRNVSDPDPERLQDRIVPLLFDPVKGVRGQAAVRLAELPSGRFKSYQQEALDEALAEYVSSMRYSLDFAFAGHNLGNLYMARGDVKQAEAYYRAALEIDDLFIPAKMNLVVLCNQQGRNEEAEQLLREILQAYPEMYEAAYSLGLLLAEVGRLPEAVGFLERAAVGNPEAPRIQYNLGLALQSVGRDEEARAALETALDLEPDNLSFLYALADFYVKHEDPRRAMALVERMIAAHPRERIGHDMKAVLERSHPEVFGSP